MEWYTDAEKCQLKITELEARPQYVAAIIAFGEGEELTLEQGKLMVQMGRFTNRLAQLLGDATQAAGKRGRPWEMPVDLENFPGSDRVELTRATNEKDKDKGLRKQYAEVQHHYVAHVTTVAAVKDVQQLVVGLELPEDAIRALERVMDLAEKGRERARARAKMLAMVSDKGPELGWPMCEKLELRSYVDNEEEDKAMRKAEKLVKAEKQVAAAAAKQRDQPRGNSAGERFSYEHPVVNVPSPPMPQDDPILLRAARGEDVERPPVWLMRQAGRYMAEFRAYSEKYPFRMRSETPDIAIELSMQPFRAFKPDGVIMFSDILTPLPAIGVEFDVIRGKGPRIDQPVRSMEDVLALKPMDDLDDRCPFLRPILSTLRQEVGNEAAVLGFVGTPWTLAAYSIEGKADRHLMHTKQMMLKNPEILKAYLDHLTEAIAIYACHQIDCGAQVIQLFDSWAHHLSPAQFVEFSLPYAEKVTAAIKAKHPEVPVIFHANGGTGKLERIAAGCSADVVGLDWATDMSAAREVFGANTTLQGNMDPMILFGSQEQIEAAVKTAVDEAGRKHILGVGHGVVQGTPEESVGIFCDAARKSVYADCLAGAK
ncbi:Uroporphyrinogen decarboxylase [Cymbomonas tetramitiformis]|uniref:Uroporphyrinogen decarboxylase n=1 Tax=Cymbomonas tetramitiformis TaxID=36881 RepID=A0AAE0EVZ1_9CHLO|nr:Uroporphyrinogen decarboxylase [Cymbomonas tetramitiformis]